MNGEEELENDDFDLEGEAVEPDAKSRVDSDIQRRLEDQLEERCLQKSIRDYDFDVG
ncbi:MAG: hypothetical protein V7699_02110 [Porticoccus sp.]